MTPRTNASGATCNERDATGHHLVPGPGRRHEARAFSDAALLRVRWVGPGRARADGRQSLAVVSSTWQRPFRCPTHLGEARNRAL